MNMIRNMTEYFEDPNVIMTFYDLQSGDNVGNLTYQIRLCDSISKYLNYLTILITKAEQLKMRPKKLAKLILTNEIRKLGYLDEDEYLRIFLNSISNDERIETTFNTNISSDLKLDCFSTKK